MRSLVSEVRQVKANERSVGQESLHGQHSLAHKVTTPDLDECAALGDAVP